jgi:DNA replication protein DnaC
MKQFKVRLPIVEVEHDSGLTYHSPLLFPDLIRLGGHAAEVSGIYAELLQRFALNKGQYRGLLAVLHNKKVKSKQLSLVFPPSPQHLFPELSLSFSYFVITAPGDRLLGIVPELGLEVLGNDADHLQAQLKANIEMAFMRQGRLNRVPAILETQWNAHTKLSLEEEFLHYHSPLELEKMNQTSGEELLGKVADRMEVPAGALFGLNKEYEQLRDQFRAAHPSSVLLVGKSGQGKSELLRQLLRDQGQEEEAHRPFWEVTASQLLNRLTALGSWEDHLAQLCNELRKTQSVLYVPRLVDLFEVGQYQGNPLSVADYLRDYLARAEIILVSECTPEEAQQIELRSPGFMGLFREVRIPEMSREQLEEIVRAKGQFLARQAELEVQEEAVDEVLRLQQWFTPYSGLPGRTLAFLEGLFAEKKQQKLSSRLGKGNIYRAFSNDTGLPETMINPDLSLPYEQVHGFFSKNIFGQETAIKTIIELLFSIKAAVIKRGQPLASLLFVGPTGVGKTELAKVLAEFLFSDRSRMVRFDMSEYADMASVLRLTGDTAGGEGQLTATVRQQPFSVILFDELEKVHPSFYDLLLQILGEGRLTDARGRVTDFCSTIIIMTSNLGARAFQTGTIGFGGEEGSTGDAEAHFRAEVQKFFRPELFNRLDRILAFAPLSREVVRRIIDRELKLIGRREGIRSRKMSLSIRPEARELLARKGYNAHFGARFLQRTLREQLLIPLSRELNSFPFHTPLLAEVGGEGEKLEIKIWEGNPQEILDQNQEKALLAFLARLTARRRWMGQARQGPVHNKLEGRLEELQQVLDRLRKKGKEARFWERPMNQQMLESLPGLLDRFEELSTEIKALETEMLLMLDKGKAIDWEEEKTLFQQWEEDLETLKHDMLAADSTIRGLRLDQVVLGVYGDKAEWMFEIYTKIIEQKGFAYRVAHLWHNPEGYPSGKHLNKHAVRRSQEGGHRFFYRHLPTESHYQPIQDEEYLMGYELEIKGPLCALYFGQEERKIRWEDKNRQVYRMRTRAVADTLGMYVLPHRMEDPAFFSFDKGDRIVKEGKKWIDRKFNSDRMEKNIARGLEILLDKEFARRKDEKFLG